MFTIEAILILSAAAVFAGFAFFLLKRRRRRHLPLPPGNDRGWTNNTIRRQGESGKGIR